MLARLAELAEREEDLVAGERWDEVVELQAERQATIDALPQPLPRAALPVLTRALERSRATEAALAAALARTNGQLTALRRSRRAISAYHRA
jgi:hypothetical protein